MSRQRMTCAEATLRSMVDAGADRLFDMPGRGVYPLLNELPKFPQLAHVTAPQWESTDWATIVAAYGALLEVSPSPVVALNRAVAVSLLAGPSAGLAALSALERPLADYHLFYATRADMLERTGGDPRLDLETAISLATNEGEKQLLERRLRDRLARMQLS